MSEDIVEYVVSHAGTSRRQFLVRLLAGSAFAVPVIASFAIGGSSSPKRSPLDAGANTDPECPNGMVWDDESGNCIVDDGGGEENEGGGDGDGGDGGSGAGLPDSK